MAGETEAGKGGDGPSGWAMLLWVGGKVGGWVGGGGHHVAGQVSGGGGINSTQHFGVSRRTTAEELEASGWREGVWW